MKKIALCLLLGGVLFSTISCDKDKPIDEIIITSNVKVTKEGAATDYTFAVTAATSKIVGSDTLCMIAASNITTQKPSLAIILRGKEAGLRTTGLDAAALIGLDIANMMQNTVIVYMSDTEYILMTNGTINVTSVTNNEIEGTFDGNGINGKALEGLTSSDLLQIATLLLSPPYHIQGSFKGFKQDM